MFIIIITIIITIKSCEWTPLESIATMHPRGTNGGHITAQENYIGNTKTKILKTQYILSKPKNNYPLS